MRRFGPHSRQFPRAFTLVELLVVIGIIAVLMGILLPSLAAARRQGNTTKCLANLRTMQTAQVMYAAENRNLLVTAANGATDQGSWLNLLDRYAPAALARRCPSDESPFFDQPASPGPPPKYRVTSYGINNYVSPTHAPPGITPIAKITQVRNSSQVIQFAELAEAGAYATADHLHVQSFSLGMPELTVGLVAKQMPLGRHDGKTMGMHSVLNYSFLDGHAETLPLADVYTDPFQNRFDPAVIK
jgi:prepilin-type N-terminal cleavage/methylation domain-containing protein/prepilin-type processing-associated H-X9-DG protein